MEHFTEVEQYNVATALVQQQYNDVVSQAQSAWGHARQYEAAMCALQAQVQAQQQQQQQLDAPLQPQLCPGGTAVPEAAAATAAVEEVAGIEVTHTDGVAADAPSLLPVAAAAAAVAGSLVAAVAGSLPAAESLVAPAAGSSLHHEEEASQVLAPEEVQLLAAEEGKAPQPPPLLSPPPQGVVDGKAAAEAELAASPRDGSRGEVGGRRKDGLRDGGEGGGDVPEEEAAPGVTAAAGTEPPLPAPPPVSISELPVVLQEELSPMAAGPSDLLAVPGASSENVDAASETAAGNSKCADEKAPNPCTETTAPVSEEAARGADEQAPKPCSTMGLPGSVEAVAPTTLSPTAEVGSTIGDTNSVIGAAPELEVGRAGSELGAAKADTAAAPEECASVHDSVEPDLEANHHNVAAPRDTVPSSSPSGSLLGPVSPADDPAAVVVAEHCAAAAAVALESIMGSATAAELAASPRSPGPAVPAEPVPLPGVTMDAGGEVDLFEGLARNDN